MLIKEKITMSPQNSKVFISTAIAYANGAPHIGHAFEFALTDTLARYLKHMYGESAVFFTTGMDEHGQKIEEKSRKTNTPVETLVEIYSDTFKDLDAKMSVQYDFFVRTSDKEKHYKGAQYLWAKLMERGDLVKRSYTALYCVGCEGFKKESDLNERGECPDHLKAPEQVEEENYFFTLSKYTKDIQTKIQNDELKIVPEVRKNEILALLDRGLEDVSFSRPKSKVSWGIPVPNDDSQVMYVWCDALSNYITALGYGTETFASEYWNNAVHVIGKDILRFHAAIWPGMLLSANLPLPKTILVHGHITSGGHKMSKSLGNVIDPQDVMSRLEKACGNLAGEALRFILLYKIPSFEDGDLTNESIDEVYTAHLANGVGNLTSRVMKMATTHGAVFSPYDYVYSEEHLVQYDVNKALLALCSKIAVLDKKINDEQAFKVVKEDKVRGVALIEGYLKDLYVISVELAFFMPKTASVVNECVRLVKMPEKALFGRLS
jgi:methionyl-tRNA synthetase